MAISQAKRQRERARVERQREKERRREVRRAEKSAPRITVPGEDPDIAGIVAGPQPIPEDL